MFKKSVVFGLTSALSVVAAQSTQECYTSGNIVGAVLATIVIIVILLVIAYILWRFYWRGRKGKHLVLVTDPEKGGDFAFDNPGFKEGTPIGRTTEKEEQKLKWQNWTPLPGLTNHGKPRALDDSYVGQPLVNVVPLRSHDFTGLGFNICGNMRDGIFVKDVLHRGPASESGRIMPGDRIESIRISFRHMVFEDALTILSYASPYEVQLEVENGSSSRPATLLRTKRTSMSPAERICHPFYRSQSISDLAQIMKHGSKKWNPEQSVNMPDLGNGDISKPAIIETSPIEKLQKFGVRVLPSNNETLRHVEPEKHQNVRNTVIESVNNVTASNHSQPNTPTKTNNANAFDEIDLSYDSNILSFDQVDNGSRKNTPSPLFKESNVKAMFAKGIQNLKEKLQHAGLKSEKEYEDETVVKKNEIKSELKANDIAITVDPQTTINPEKQLDKMSNKELAGHFNMPEEVEKAGLAARSNRKSIVEMEHKRKDSCSGESSNDGDGMSIKKGKRKAPPPPQSLKSEDNIDSVNIQAEDEENRDSLSDKNQSLDSADTDSEHGDKSGTTIELNASHITVHHTPDSDSNRKAASLGDLSRLDNEQPIVVLERAVSLDLADGTPGGSKKRKAPLPPQEEFSDDGGHPFCKEARMENNLKARLKKSSDFGRLEDVVKYSETDDEDSDQGISVCSSPEVSPNIISSTPMKPDFFSDSFLKSDLNLKTPSDKLGKESSNVHISSCSWDLSIPDNLTEQYMTAVNGNSTEEEDDIPPELPTSPIPTYITEIQVVTSTGKNNVDSGFENGEHKRENSQDMFPLEIKEMSSFMRSFHKPLLDLDHRNVMPKNSEISMASPTLSDSQTTILQETFPMDGFHVSLSQPNSLDTISQNDFGNNTSKEMQILPNTSLLFSNENMSDEQILAMKSSPEPLSLDNGQTKLQITKPDRTRNNISVTSIKANSGSRIPIRAAPEPSRKVKKENYVNFSSLNMSPTNDKHQNGSGGSSVTKIVLDTHK
uniref:PDZ domain-containing protein n=1 Tax=Clastoptera arizonana TaxID=38151 RepID=A0A1B6DBC9_9HEMI